MHDTNPDQPGENVCAFGEYALEVRERARHVAEYLGTDEWAIAFTKMSPRAQAILCSVCGISEESAATGGVGALSDSSGRIGFSITVIGVHIAVPHGMPLGTIADEMALHGAKLAELLAVPIVGQHA